MPRAGQVPPLAAEAGRDRGRRGDDHPAVLRLSRLSGRALAPDGQLGLTAGDLSRGAAELAALAGTLGSFAEAATKTLPKLAGLRISESTVERTTERVGDHVGERCPRATRSARIGRGTGPGTPTGRRVRTCPRT